MILSNETSIIEAFTRLFVESGEERLCSIGEYKHSIEHFSEVFGGERHYIPREVAGEVLSGMGYSIKDDVVCGEWKYPTYEELYSTLGSDDFDRRFIGDQIDYPFYRIPSSRVKAMVNAYSAAHDLNGRYRLFPIFKYYEIQSMCWVEYDGGTLGYMDREDEVFLDTIYTPRKRSGVGTSLFVRFLKEMSDGHRNNSVEIVIDAYTDDSKAFFGSMAKRYNFMRESERFGRSGAYTFSIQDIKEYFSNKKEG